MGKEGVKAGGEQRSHEITPWQSRNGMEHLPAVKARTQRASVSSAALSVHLPPNGLQHRLHFKVGTSAGPRQKENKRWVFFYVPQQKTYKLSQMSHLYFGEKEKNPKGKACF